MKVAWLAVVLSLAPGIAAAQIQPSPATPVVPGTTQTVPGTIPGAVSPVPQTIDPSAPGAPPAPGTAPPAPGTGPTVPGTPTTVDPRLPPGTPATPSSPFPFPTPTIGGPPTPPASEPVPPIATTPGPARIIGPTVPALPSGAPTGGTTQLPGLIIGAPPQGAFPIDVSPRVPPPSTIPSGPSVILPAPPSRDARVGRTFNFQPTLRISEEWTDNFNLSERDRTSNFRTTVAPGVQVLLDSGALTGSASYTLSAFHDSSIEEFGVQNSLAAFLSWQALPTWRLTLSEAFFQSDDPERTDRLLLTRARRDSTSNQTSLTSDYALLALGLDTKQYYRYSHFASSSSTDAHTFGLSASRALDRIHVVTLGYEYLMSDSTRSDAAAPSGKTSVRGHQVSGTFSRDVSALLTAGLTGAFAVRDLEGTPGPSTFERWNAAVFVNYSILERLILRANVGVGRLSGVDETVITTASTLSYWFARAVLTLGVERGFSETFGQSEDFGVVKTTGVSGSILYRFSPLLSAEVNGSYRENDFTGIGSVAPNDARSDTVYAAGLSVVYQITRGLSASIDATHTESEGRSGRSFTENRVRAALSAILY
jgi:hypothetical protein